MTEINHSEVLKFEPTGYIDRFAKAQLQKKLKSLPSGCLRIDDDGDVAVFGSQTRQDDVQATMIIHQQSAYRDIVFGGSTGAAEAYMLGKWTSPNLVDLVRLMAINIDFLNELDDSRLLLQRVTDRCYHWFKRNSQNQARLNIAAHYDLSNDFFRLFLDPQMMYSSAIFEQDSDDLDIASIHKLDVVCKKLELKADDHLLEIGSGWGGLAIHAARKYGCRVTTTTISKEQYEETCKRVAKAGLGARITVLFEDYRNLQGSFDKLVSIEMIEAVGQKYYKEYFNGCSALLKPDGLMLLQSITIPSRRYHYALKSVDFIQRYIFPGGSLPSHEIILSSVRKHSDFEMVAMREICDDYAKTLAIWHQRFNANLKQVRELGFDECFIRMWNFYLCYCQGAFTERAIGTTQILLAKPQWRAKALSTAD